MQTSMFSRLNPAVRLAIAIATCCLVSAEVTAAENEYPPETVLVTLRVKPGKEAEMEKVLAESWATYQRLRLVQEQPAHLVMRGIDDRKAPFFTEVLTWTSPSVPDHAPAEVLALWKRMHALCESRDGHPDIEFSEVRLVSGMH